VERWRVRVLIAASLAMGTTGCYTAWDIAPQSVQNLNGFHEGERRPLADTSGGAVSFDKSTELRFIDPSGVRAAKFSSIVVDGPSLTGVVRPTHEPIAVDLRQVATIQARKFSPGKTALAIVIPAVVVTVALTVLVIVVAAASCCFVPD